jgi:hypothetical protein
MPPELERHLAAFGAIAREEAERSRHLWAVEHVYDDELPWMLARPVRSLDLKPRSLKALHSDRQTDRSKSQHDAQSTEHDTKCLHDIRLALMGRPDFGALLRESDNGFCVARLIVTRAREHEATNHPAAASREVSVALPTECDSWLAGSRSSARACARDDRAHD